MNTTLKSLLVLGVVLGLFYCSEAQTGVRCSLATPCPAGSCCTQPDLTSLSGLLSLGIGQCMPITGQPGQFCGGQCTSSLCGAGTYCDKKLFTCVANSTTTN